MDDGTEERRRNPAFELFILGELMDEPHHGYLLRDILTRMLGPFRRVSWATIYPLLRQLEHAGLIAAESMAATRPPGEARRGESDELGELDNSGAVGKLSGSIQPETRARPSGARGRRLAQGGPAPRRYQLTEAGRRRFLALLGAADEYTADYPELFTIKLLYMQFLSPKQQRALLTHGLGYFTRQREHIQHVFTAQSTTAHLPPQQRAVIWRMNRFRLASAVAQARWIEDELARLDEPD